MLGNGGILGCSKLKVPCSAQIFIGGMGGGYSWVLKTQSAKFIPNFHLPSFKKVQNRSQNEVSYYKLKLIPVLAVFQCSGL